MIELSDLLTLPGARLLREGPDEFPGGAINSGDIGGGELFFALRGNRDGHDFVPAAIEAGAGGVVLERELPGIPEGVTAVLVPDTLQALQALGAATRARSSAVVTAVTGSAGKTTTKSMVAHVLASRFSVLSNEKSFNNHLGVPLNLLRIAPEHGEVVAEVGTNHRGEIAALAALVRPDIALVTNIGFAHIGYFAGREELAVEKTDLLRSVAPGGLCIVNGDDELLENALRGRRLAEGVRVLRVGFNAGNDYRASAVRCDETGTTGTVTTADGESADFHVPLAGRHFAYAVLFSLAVAGARGIPLAAAAAALDTFAPPPGRASLVRTRPKLLVVDDSYNASPDATLAALDLLGGLNAEVRVAVLGEMRELGEWSSELHKLVGKAAAGAATHLVVVGAGGRDLIEAAEQEGFDPARASSAESARDAYLKAEEILTAAGDGTDCAVLAKGSRFMHMERVPLGLAGTTVTCPLDVCPLYINCKDCAELSRPRD